MQSLTVICTAWLLVAGASVLVGQTTAQAEKLLESARHKEVMQGDLKAAIEQYRKIATQFANQPEIAARALFQLGQCQEKLGQAEARKSYERIVREYGAAQQYASAARLRLAALGGGAPAGQQATRVVWTGPNVSAYASSLSPDGRSFTFPHWDTGNLGLHDLVTGADRLLTNTGTFKEGETAYAEGSAISRDGKQAAYAWYDHKLGRYELWVLGLNGDAKPRRVFGNTSVSYMEPRDWSPDGKWIAATLWDKGMSQMGLIGAQDGSLRLLKSLTDRPTIGGFSSDGRYIAYSGRVPGNSLRAYIHSVDEQIEVPLIPGNASTESPVWTPDGSRVVFVSDWSGTPGLWSVRISDGKPVGDPELLKSDFSNANPMVFSRDGSLYYEVRLAQTDIYLASLDPSTGRLTSEPRRVNQSGVSNSWGRIHWLPDGKALSFWNRLPIQALVVHTLSTGEEREIWGGKSGRPGSGSTGWFPDGHSLMSSKPDGATLMFRRVDSRTGETKATWTVPRLSPDSIGPEYSPDLMTMYFWQNNQAGPCEGVDCRYAVMFARDLGTGRDREIFRMKANITSARIAISRDGQQMAFASRGGLMVAPTAGGPPRAISDLPSNDVRGLAWTQDGTHVLAFRSLPKGAGGEVWSISLKGGSPEKSTLRMQPSEPPAVSPDGTQVAFVGGGRKSKIWVMTGLFPDAKPAAPR